MNLFENIKKHEVGNPFIHIELGSNLKEIYDNDIIRIVRSIYEGYLNEDEKTHTCFVWLVSQVREHKNGVFIMDCYEQLFEDVYPVQYLTCMQNIIHNIQIWRSGSANIMDNLGRYIVFDAEKVLLGTVKIEI